jgi:hypothetical protein
MEMISGIEELPMKSLTTGMTASICYGNFEYEKDYNIKKRALKDLEETVAKGKEENQ